MRRQLPGHVDRGRAIRPADDANSSSLRDGEVEDTNLGEHQCAQERCKNSKLSGGTQEQGPRIGKERTEIRHGPDSHENKQREKARTDTHGIELIQDAIANSDVDTWNIGKDSAEANRH